MNRKNRKAKKMQLRRIGMETYIPNPNDIITASFYNLPTKVLKHVKDGSIECKYLKGCEFYRMRKKK